MDQQTTRVCKKCQQEKDLLTDFYKHHGEYYYNVCRKCKIENNTRFLERKVRGFAAASEETKNIIIQGIQDGKRIASIARESNVPYYTLLSWVRTDQVHPVLRRQNAHDPLMEYELGRLNNM